MRVPSSDGVMVAVHDFGGSGRELLISHATGFHAHCYLPMVPTLSEAFHCYALDHRGHGATERPEDPTVVWERYGDDALAAARAVAPEGGLIGFGHSMGGATLLMAAHRDPELFDLIIAFEPIVFPPSGSEMDHADSPLVEGARRRRAWFPSVDDAIGNYASKPPLNAFTPEALRCYVEHGTRPDADGVRLRCEPEHEAATFAAGGVHRTWDLLAEIKIPVVILAGRVEEMRPSMIAKPISEQLPDATYVALEHLDHFGPMTHPNEIAELIRSFAAQARS